MAEQNETIGRTKNDGEDEVTQVSTLSSGILLGGIALTILWVLVTDFSKLSGEWNRLARVVMGEGMEGKTTASSTENILLWNDEVKESMGQLEDRFDLESPFCQWVQPKLQGWLASMGEGGEEVMVGKDGWLFYRPSFDHLTARTSAPKKQRTQGYEAAFHAIRRFATHLRSRGIELVIVPVPPKLAVHPEHFTEDRQKEIIKPEVFKDWLARIGAEGVRIFDTEKALSSFENQSSVPAYLKSDTHWRPEAMEWCAARLGEYLEAGNLLKSPRSAGKEILVPGKITARGDLWRMLRLNESSHLVTPEEVPINQIQTSAGMRWQPSRKAETLLLGDSFCNIFSLGQMEWGEGAGFAEHLSHKLGRPVDTILRNSDGAHATRRILSRELAKGVDRLDGKSVVVWEFAARELTQGRWLDFPYQLGEKVESQFIEVDSEQFVELEASVVEVSPIPVPGSVPYQDFVATVHLREVKVISGNAEGTEILGYAKAMEGNQWSSLAGFRSGQRVRVRVGSWIDVEGQFGRWNRSEASEDLLLEPVNWFSEITLVGEGD